MVKVVHFDHAFYTYKGPISKLQEEIGNYPEISYKYISSSERQNFEEIKFGEVRNSLEQLLPECDVLLIHPGVEGQAAVLMEYPEKFPNLRIALVTETPMEYVSAEEDSGIYFSRHAEPQKIIDFILDSRKQKFDRIFPLESENHSSVPPYA